MGEWGGGGGREGEVERDYRELARVHIESWDNQTINNSNVLNFVLATSKLLLFGMLDPNFLD